MFNFNGSIRPIQVRDLSAKVDVVQREKADTGRPGHIASPFTGLVTPRVAEGDEVEAGQTVAVIEAMKMESSITTPVAGVVTRVVINAAQSLAGGDLVLVVE